MARHLISFPKSGRTWLRYALFQLGVGEQIAFHHDGFEYNDGTRPPLDFDISARRSRYGNTTQIVYLSREPRDVMVSLYRQVTGRFSDFFHYEGNISSFIRDDYFGAHNLAGFQKMWTVLCEEGLALNVTYEECHDDFPSVLRRIVSHYGFVATDEDIASTAAESTFEKMAAVERAGDFPKLWLRTRNGAPKVFEGRVGSYRNVLSEDDIRYLDCIFG